MVCVGGTEEKECGDGAGISSDHHHGHHEESLICRGHLGERGSVRDGRGIQADRPPAQR
jgi:hypothetical protein